MPNKYLLIFILVMVLAIAGIVLAIIHNRADSSKQGSNSQTLSASELSQLQGSNPVVGDAKENLTIQSNTTFNGSVLVKSDVSIAGSLKIGSALNLPGISVSGTSSFGQLHANSLTVSGDVVSEGNMTVQKSLAVSGGATFGGAVSASELVTPNLQLQSDLSIDHHITTSGGAPSKSNGPALGGGGTASVSGTDTAGTVQINTGNNPPSGCLVTVAFNKAFSSTPHIALTPLNSSAAGLEYYAIPSSGGFSVCSAAAPSGGQSFSFDYIVIG